MLYWRGCRPSQRGLLRIGSQPIQPPGCMWGRSNPTHASRQPPSQASPIFLVRKPPPCLTTQPGASGARHCGRTTLTGHHRLLVTGPAADLVRLRSAAAGAGTVPWHLDFDHMEEDLFHLLVAPPARTGALEYRARSLSLAGARILAGQLRTAAERRHGLAIAQIGHSQILSSNAARTTRRRWTGFGRIGGPRRRCALWSRTKRPRSRRGPRGQGRGRRQGRGCGH
jgi:hypothetical protein